MPTLLFMQGLGCYSINATDRLGGANPSYVLRTISSASLANNSSSLDLAIFSPKKATAMLKMAASALILDYTIERNEFRDN